MQDRELYQEILGLKSPWTVSRVTLNLEEQQVDVFVGHPSGTKFCCPECSATALATTTLLNASGGTLTVVNSRRSCTRAFRESTVLSME